MARFHQKFERTEPESPTTPEQELWMSVLSKAAHDAVYVSDWFEARKAISWFKSKSDDFKQVCSFAGFNPEYVYQKMIKPISYRENHMESVRNGNRLYIKDSINFSLENIKTRGRPKKKHLTGNAYYKAKREELEGRPRRYNNV